VMACDVVVAATGSSFSLPEATLGRVANAGGLFRTFERLPRNVALELLLTGGRLDVARAYDLGLVNRISDPGAAVEVALVLARDICGSAPNSVTQVMRAVRTVSTEQDEAGWATTARALANTVDSDDRVEGNAAFLERRPPRWVPEG